MWVERHVLHASMVCSQSKLSLVGKRRTFHIHGPWKPSHASIHCASVPQSRSYSDSAQIEQSRGVVRRRKNLVNIGIWRSSLSMSAWRMLPGLKGGMRPDSSGIVLLKRLSKKSYI